MHKCHPSNMAPRRRLFVGFSEQRRKRCACKALSVFTVNTPVTVSLMRHTRQRVIPFWLPEARFIKTDQFVKNAEGYEYEDEKKNTRQEKSNSALTGFDKPPVYFISVAPENYRHSN